MTVKLSGSLPKEHDRNGMERLHAQLVKHPERRHIVVMVVDCISTKVDHGGDGDRYTPTAGALFVEPITDDADVDTITDIMARTRAERIDDATLDFDFGVGTDPMAKAAFDLPTASGVYTDKDGDRS